MATSDLTNPIFLPNGVDTANENPIARSDKIIRQGQGKDVETSLTDLETTMTTLVGAESGVSLSWLFNSGVTDASNPGVDHFALNNALKDDATIISFHTDSNLNNARFGDLLENLNIGSYIFLHERDAPNTSILYRVNGLPTVDGTKINVPIERRLDQGGEITSEAVVQFLIWANFTPSASLPNQFLDEIEEVDRNAYALQGTPAGETFGVRFWLRTALVTPAGINDPGTGLVIAESNGENGENDNQFIQNTNAAQSFLYVALVDSLVPDIANLYVRVLDEDGNEVESLNMLTHFTEQTALSGLANGTIYLLTSGARGGSFLHYLNNETIELFIASNDPFFDIPASNEDDVDFTRTIKNLPESRLDQNLQLKINNDAIPFDDQFKLDQFVEVTTTTASGILTGSTQLLYKLSTFSPDTEDYFSTDFDTGIPPSIGGITTWYIAVPHQYNLQSFTGIDGTTNVTLFKSNIRLTPSSVNNNQDIVYNTYIIAVPDAISGTPTNLTPNGTETTITELDPTSLIKIGRTNIDPNFLITIESHGQDGEITSLQGKMNILFPLATFVDRLVDWGGIYTEEHTGQNVAITTGYSLLADFRTTMSRFESAGVTYTAGTGVSTYTGLTDNYQRAFAFKVTAASDDILMWVIDAGDNRIPFVDITVGGEIRINNYTPEITTDISGEVTFLALASGSTTLTTTPPLPRAVYTIPDFPLGSTNQSQSVSADFEVLVNGTDLGAGGGLAFVIPVTPVNQSRIDEQHTFNLGPLHNNRLVTVTIGHRLQISGSDYQIDFTLQSAPSDITLRVNGVELVRNYTAAATIARVDDFQSFATGLGTYTFTGEQEFIISFQPSITSSNTTDVIGASVGADGIIHQFNDIRITEPEAGFENVEVPDDIEFRTFLPDHFYRHSDLASLLTHRGTMWDYGLARLNEIISRSVTQPVDLAAGSSIDGTTLVARAWTAAQSFTAAASVTVTLPGTTTLADYVFIEVTWHTGVGTATDNDNRNYTELGSMQAIIDGTDAEIILGGRGRGADNYGIEVTVPTAGTETTIALDIVNLNDAGGATLPTGSLITGVSFY